MIIIETKMNVHIFKDREVDHVEYNRELSNVLLYFMAEGLLDEKKTETFEDVLNVRYMTDACPKAYDFKSSEQGRMLRELLERRSLDLLNYRLTRILYEACEFLERGGTKSEELEKSIEQMLKERSEIYERINKIRISEEKQ